MGDFRVLFFLALVFSLAFLGFQVVRTRHREILVTILLLAVANGCRSIQVPDVQERLIASNHRNWRPNLAVLPRAEMRGNQLTVYNIRNCVYFTEDDYVLSYYDKTFDLSELESLDFVVVPFTEAPSLAHTMLSFGFARGDYLAVSVEVRLEEGERYSPLLGALRQFEIMYVVGDERDLIKLRTEQRKVDVYVYRARADRQQIQRLLVDIMGRVNQLVDSPEFYDTLTNNCTTNIVRHINRLHPGRIPLDYRVLLPGYSDQLAYELGLLDTDLSFAETKRRARVNDLAERYVDSPDFSRQIRR